MFHPPVPASIHPHSVGHVFSHGSFLIQDGIGSSDGWAQIPKKTTMSLTAHTWTVFHIYHSSLTTRSNCRTGIECAAKQPASVVRGPFRPGLSTKLASGSTAYNQEKG
ncbi:hypothetical protein PspLS_08641 [Pyricularia sp. CBS 133598]|nr:hypothetical protein PspLS_08641 [Pyricularia sp. CBS 133598]